MVLHTTLYTVFHVIFFLQLKMQLNSNVEWTVLAFSTTPALDLLMDSVSVWGRKWASVLPEYTLEALWALKGSLQRNGYLIRTKAMRPPISRKAVNANGCTSNCHLTKLMTVDERLRKVL